MSAAKSSLPWTSFGAVERGRLLSEIARLRAKKSDGRLTLKSRQLFGYQSNVAEQLCPIHTVVMGVQSALSDFMRWVTVGTGTVLGVILLVCACIPQRSTARPRHLAKGPR